jgi:hypothetical protein
MPTNWKAFGRSMQHFVIFFYFLHVPYSFANAVKNLKRQLMHHSLLKFFLAIKFCPSLLETVGVRVPT